MPELPEVETSRISVDKVAQGHVIAHAVADLDDRFVFDRQKPAQIAKALVGKRILCTGRRGKYFWLSLSDGMALLLHLGMTGGLKIRQPHGGRRGKSKQAWDGLKLWSDAAENQGEFFLAHARLRLTLKNGVEIAFTDPRRFGRIRLIEDPAQEPTLLRLGFDPLLSFPGATGLYAVLQRRRAPIKSVLLDQKVFAGVGNWIADEVLFQAAVAPQRLAASLSLKEVATLRRKLLAIIQFAVRVRADSSRYPRSWLFHHRWGKMKGAQISGGHAVAFTTIGGRTTAWVPTRQS